MPWRAQFRIHTRQRGPCLISPHLWDSRTFASDTYFDIEPQKRSRLTKLGAQTQHRVIQQFVPPSASKQSEITCARDKCVVFHNIGQAISGSTEEEHQRLSTKKLSTRKDRKKQKQGKNDKKKGEQKKRRRKANYGRKDK